MKIDSQLFTLNYCKVSVTMAVGRRLPWTELPAYLLGQVK